MNNNNKSFSKKKVNITIIDLYTYYFKLIEVRNVYNKQTVMLPI